MSTATLLILDNNKPIVNIYSNGGSPITFGRYLYNLLKNVRMVEEVVPEKEDEIIANGITCLAAQLVSKLKTEIGLIYLRPIEKIYDTDYTYKLNYSDKFEIKVYYMYCEIFSGDLNQFENFVFVNLKTVTTFNESIR